MADPYQDVVRGQEDAPAEAEAEDSSTHDCDLVVGKLSLAVVAVGRKDLVETASQVAAVGKIFLAPAPDQRALDVHAVLQGLEAAQANPLGFRRLESLSLARIRLAEWCTEYLAVVGALQRLDDALGGSGG